MATADISSVVSVIIKYQKALVGPLAVTQAEKVDGIKVVNQSTLEVEITSDKEPRTILEGLVVSYEELFGRASVEVCKEAIKDGGVVVDRNDLPGILQ